MYGKQKKKKVKMTRKTEASEMVQAIGTSRGMKGKEVHDSSGLTPLLLLHPKQRASA